MATKQSCRPRNYLISKTAKLKLTGKPTGRRPFGRPRCRWEDNIRMNLKEIAINMRNWVDSAQERDCWRAMELVIYLMAIRFLYSKKRLLE